MSEKFPEILERAKILVFDFDGTLVDSNAIKISAFAKCFAPYEEKFQEIMEYCRQHHHTPRKVKFRHVFEKILRQPYTRDIETEMLKQYASWTTEQVILAKEIRGAKRFLKSKGGGKKTGLLSSTPHEILLDILRARGLYSLFWKIQGAPVEKGAWLCQLKMENNLDGDEILFFGDTKEDSESARKAEVGFIAVGQEEVKNSLLQIKDFREILKK